MEPRPSAGEPVDHVRQLDESIEVTRHLCQTVYLDPTFRAMVIGVHNSPYRRVAPSYGFDLVPIVEHAWRAWILETSQRICMLTVLVIGLTSNVPATLMAGCGVVLWRVAGLMLRTAASAVRRQARAISGRMMRLRLSADEDVLLRHQGRLLVICAVGCVLLVVVPMEVARSTGAGTAPAALLLFLLMAVVAAGVGVVRQLALNGVYSARSLRPARLTKRQQVIDAQQSHTYVVYRNNAAKPFVGCGLRVYRWLPPLVIQLLRPGDGDREPREYLTAPFRPQELVDHIKRAMLRVGDPVDPARMLGFQIRDRLYVNEMNVVSDLDCLRTEPRRSDIVRIIDAPHETTHHYLEIQVTGHRQLVVTIFLRVTIVGGSLCVDFSACALTGTPVEYRLLDLVEDTGRGAVLRSALRELRYLPNSVINLWRLAEVPVVLACAAWARTDRSLTSRRRIRIGSLPNIREINSLPWERAQLDKETVYRNIKIMEQRILGSVEDFLRSRGVDTSVFETRVANIINSGVINFGDMEISKTVIGENAQGQFGSGGAGAAGAAGGAES